MKFTVSSSFPASNTSSDFVHIKKSTNLRWRRLLRAFSGVHADGQSTSRRPGPRVANRREEFNLCDLLKTNLSSRVIEGEPPHRPSNPGANHFQRGDAVLQVGLYRQNAGEPPRFHGLVALYSFDTSPDTHSEVTETAWRCKMPSCAALQARATAAAPKQGSNTLRAPAKNTQKHRRNTSTETEKPTRFQRAHNRRTNKESAQNNINRQRIRRRK